MAQDVEWKQVGTSYRVNVDQRAQKGFTGRQKAKLTLDDCDNVDKTVLDFFVHFFPMEQLEPMCAKMTAAGKEKGYGDHFNITKGILLRWIGLWTSMCTAKLESRRAYWRKEKDPALDEAENLDGLSSGMKFGKYMSRAMFDKILTVFVLDQHPVPPPPLELKGLRPTPSSPCASSSRAATSVARRRWSPLGSSSLTNL